jgi:type II secretory pathway pseudopilin PulG
MLRNNKGQWSLIEILVVVAIIAVASVVIYPRYVGGGSHGTGGGKHADPPAPMERAQGIECTSNLGQIRAAINMYQSSNGSYPASLDDLKTNGVTASISKCPVSGTPYQYDAATGKVSCATPGHEKF